MAVIKKFKVTIQVDGNDLPEYPDIDDGPQRDDSSSSDSDSDLGGETERDNLQDDDTKNARNIVSYFVEAKPASEFVISYSLSKDFKYGKADFIAWAISLDGQRLFGAVMPKHEYCLLESKSGTRDGVTTRQGCNFVKEKFKFAKLSIRDLAPEESAHDLKARYGDLGVIKVEVWRMRGGVEPKGELTRTLERQSSVPEKALKGNAISLATSLSPAQKAPRLDVWSGTKIGTKPLATFIFKYRTQDDLKKMRIIYRTPTPVPLEDRPLEDLTPEEALELLKRQKAVIDANKVKIKQENREANTRLLDALKRSHSTMTSDDDDNEVQEIASPVKKVLRTEVVELSD